MFTMICLVSKNFSYHNTTNQVPRKTAIVRSSKKWLKSPVTSLERQSFISTKNRFLSSLLAAEPEKKPANSRIRLFISFWTRCSASQKLPKKRINGIILVFHGSFALRSWNKFNLALRSGYTHITYQWLHKLLMPPTAYLSSITKFWQNIYGIKESIPWAQ